jgi:hypothetical protein
LPPGTDMDRTRLRLSHMQKGTYYIQICDNILTCKGTYYIQIRDNILTCKGTYYIQICDNILTCKGTYYIQICNNIIMCKGQSENVQIIKRKLCLNNFFISILTRKKTVLK